MKLNLKQILTAVQALEPMFPNLKITQAISEAKKMIDDGGSPADILNNAKIDKQGINSVFQKYGNHPQARILLNKIGMTPENLRDSAISLLGDSKTPNNNKTAPQAKKQANNNGFRRL